MEKILDVAKYIFDKYSEISGEAIDEMKLHKLLYFVQRESLAITGKPMFLETFEGWKYGPVCRQVREHYTPDEIFYDSPQRIKPGNAYIVNNIMEQYASIESWKLSELSHQELSWRNARQGLDENQNGSKLLLIDDIKKDAQKVRPYDSVWDMYYDEFEDLEAEA